MPPATLPALTEWQRVVAEKLPQLSKPQAVGLALWSFGMVMMQSCGLTNVSSFLAALLGQKDNTVRQRLREWYQEAHAKKTAPAGGHRQELNVTQCFAPLLQWVLSLWPAAEHRIALVLDASSLGARWVVLAISVVYRGCAIPVAWVILPANTRGAWKPHWQALLRHLQLGLPADWCVLVLADRGLYARWLFQAICANHWHPFLRINQQGLYRRQGHARWYPLATLLQEPGQTWAGAVVCFKGCPVNCTLLAAWTAAHTDPWLVLTDLAPQRAQVAWYGLRTWIEAGFKDTKRGGWQWQNTRMTAAARVTRHWLAIAVATLWAVSVGGEAEATLPPSSFTALPELHIARRTARRTTRPRLVSCFRRGILTILVALLQGLPLPLGRFIPEPWPSLPELINVPGPPLEVPVS